MGDEVLKKKLIDQVKRTRDYWESPSIHAVSISLKTVLSRTMTYINRRFKKGAVPTTLCSTSSGPPMDGPMQKMPRSAYMKRE